MLICVKSHHARATIVVLAMLLAGCRMADGPLPSDEGDVPNEITDLSRDLYSVANHDPSAIDDLLKDVTHYAEGNGPGIAAAAELSRSLATALSGKTFMVAEALPLARSCWLAVVGRQLSDQQVTNLQNDVKSQLMMLDVDEQQAQAIAGQVGAVQQAVTARHRRWYELL